MAVKTLTVLATALTVAGLASAGEVISFSVNNSTANEEYSGIADGADSRTRVQNRYWNNLVQTESGYDPHDVTVSDTLVDETGATVENLSITASCYGSWQYDDTSAFGEKGYNYTDGPWNATVSNVPYAKYELILYMATDNGGLSWGAVGIVNTDGTTTYYVPDEDDASTAIAAEATTTWGQTAPSEKGYGTNVIRIRNLTNPTLSFTTCKADDTVRAGLHGFQIVKTDEAPETDDVYDLTTDGSATKLTDVDGGDLVSNPNKAIKIVLPDGGTFTVDGTYAFAAIEFVCEGSATVVATDASVANITKLYAEEFDETATLVYTTSGAYSSDKFKDFDIVRLAADENGFTSSTEGFGARQLIVTGGTVDLSSNLSTTIETAEKPMTVTGEGSTLRISGSNNKNSSAYGGVMRAENGGTLEIAGVNLFWSQYNAHVQVDDATLRAINSAGSHMKVVTLTMSNGALFEMAGEANAYSQQGFFLKTHNASTPAKLIASEGTSEMKYAEGATQNNFFIESDYLEVASDATLKVNLNITTTSDSINKVGAGVLETTDAWLANTTINEGTLRVNAGASAELTKAIAGTGTLEVALTDTATVTGSIADGVNLVVTTAGTLNLGASRPMLAQITTDTVIGLTPTSAELDAGSIVLSVADGVTLTTNNLAVADVDGFTLGEDGKTLTLTASIPTWRNGEWSTTPVIGKDVIIDFNGSSEKTCTWEQADSPSYRTLIIKGSGTLNLTGSDLEVQSIQVSDATTDAVSIGSVGEFRLTGAFTGAADVTWTQGWFTQQNSAILLSTFTGALTIAGGTWQWGKNNGTTVNDSNGNALTLGSSVTINAGARLYVHPWTTGQQTKSNANKVRLRSGIVLNGGMLRCEDGSYFFDSVRVNETDEPSTIFQQYGGKMVEIDQLFGAGAVTFQYDGANYPSGGGYLCVWWTREAVSNTQFTGTLALRSTRANQVMYFESDATTSFGEAKIDLGENCVYRITGARLAGALVGTGTVQSSSTGTQTLTIGGYQGELASTNVFSGVIADTMRLGFTTNATFRLTGALGTEGEDGTWTYTKGFATSVPAGAKVTLACANGTTWANDREISVAGEFGANATISGALTFNEGSTLDARAGLITATGTLTGVPNIRVASNATFPYLALSVPLSTTGKAATSAYLDDETEASKAYRVALRDDGYYVEWAGGFTISIR